MCVDLLPARILGLLNSADRSLLQANDDEEDEE